jgi:CubicO group peptidase (beta-lactamase class C family)
MEAAATAFAAVEEAVREAVAAGREVGLQVAVVVGDDVVFETAAGLADTADGREVDAGTLFPVFSATKGLTATAIHLQAERGLLSYDRPIADYWPEFAAGGKAAATVRHALLHQVGIPQMPPGTTIEDMADWERMTAAVAALPALWEPGTRMGYHAYTYGWILGEVVRRVDPAGRSIGRFVREEIAAPVGATDLWIGIPDEVEPRIARLEEGRPPRVLPDGALLGQAIPLHLDTNQEVFGRADVRRSEQPGAGGIMNARSLARMYGMLAAGGVTGGRRLLSADRILAASAVSCDTVDAVMDRRVLRGLGYWIAGEPLSASSAPMGPQTTSFGHPGAGGAIGWADRRRRAGVAILKNRMLSPAIPAENPLTAIGDAIRDALDRR